MEPPRTPKTVPPPQDARIVQLEAQLTELSAKLQKMTDIAARAQADLQNAKIRMQKDGQDIRKFAAEAFIRRLLPTIDNVQRAALHLPPDLAGNEWVKGILSTEQAMMRELSSLGLARMECLGKPVDTAVHEVVGVAPGAEGVILDVIEEGYTLNGKVIRPAKVRVGDGSVSERATG